MINKNNQSNNGPIYLAILCCFVCVMYSLSLIDNYNNRNNKKEVQVLIENKEENSKGTSTKNITENTIVDNIKNTNEKQETKIISNNFTQKLQWIGAMVVIAFIAFVFVIVGITELGVCLFVVDLILLLFFIFVI